MRFYLLFCFVTAAAYTAANIASAALIVTVWRRCRGSAERLRANRRAQAIAMLRLAPVALGSVAAIVLGGVFLRFEPRDTAESPGLLLVLAAAAAMYLMVVAAGRIAVLVRGNRRCARLAGECGREWKRIGNLPVWIVDTAYPVAAIAGVFRLRLLMSARILDECTAAEIDAIIRHEVAHLRRRDNVVRAAMRCLPDALSLTAAGAAMEQAWSAAVEQAADDEAGGADMQSRTELAAALVRVARMAQGPPPAWMPATVAFYEGTNLEGRVRRLLVPGASQRPLPLALASATALAASGVALVWSDAAAGALHGTMEAVVRLLS